MIFRLVLFAAAIIVATGCETNPITGRQQLALVPEDQIIQASAQAYSEQMDEYRRKGALESNTPAVARVRRIAAGIVEQAQRVRPETRQWNWQINVIDQPEVNAFAMAGGKIAVYQGLLDRVAPTDDELAQVLAHEVGHALSGHTREKMSVSLGTDLALAAFGAAQGASEATMRALATGAQLAIQLPNSRRMESEADRIGLELAARAGYNPNAAVSLWQKMARLKGGGGPPEILSTHPSDETRLNDLRELVPRMMPYYESARR
ncbi:MAG: M48 family metallopeptidase [Pseudomonadota bacterium]